jgi:osmotically-inducible protein OsmY
MCPLVFAAAVAAVFVTGASLCASETDDRIESSFMKTYVNRVYLKDDAVKTVAKDGVVTLTGQVNEVSHKYLAQEAVAGLPGVLRVDNQLVVKMEGTDKSDSWIQAKVRSVLALHRNVSDSSTQVDIKDSVITLRGVAMNEAQRDLATAYAEDVNGVLKVINMMTVLATPGILERTAVEKMDDASVTALVKTALSTHRSTTYIKIRVEARDGEVTLTGMAKNAAEIALVTKLVNDIWGVTNVKNLMMVEESLPK